MVAAAEAIVRPVQALLPAGPRHHLVDEMQQAASLWRQIVDGPPQHLGGQLVGHRDVFQRHLDVFDLAVVVLDGPHRALMLVQERDGADQRQVLHVVAARAGLVVQEGQTFREGIGNQQGPEQALGIAVEGQRPPGGPGTTRAPARSGGGVAIDGWPEFARGPHPPSAPDSGSGVPHQS